MTTVSAIVVNSNGKLFLRECFDSLRSQTFNDFDTILVDNGSTDGSVEDVRQEFPEVRVIALNHNAGFAEGNNVGIRASTGTYIALLNNDTKAHPRWLGSLNTTLDAHPLIAFRASRILLYDQPDVIDSAGDLFYSCGVGAKRGRSQKDDERFAEPMPVFGACAAAGGVLEVIAEGEDGLLVPFGDVRTLCRRMATLLDDEAMRRQLGEAG